MAQKKDTALAAEVESFASSADLVAPLDTEPRKVDKEEPDNPDAGKLDKPDAESSTVFATELNDPPLRTNRPNVPIRAHLATGAGQHVPLNDPELDADGRLRPDLQVEVALEQQAEANKTADSDGK